MRALKVSYSDVGEGGVAVNYEKNTFFPEHPVYYVCDIISMIERKAVEMIFFVVNRSWWEGDNVCVDKKVLNKPKRHNYGPYKCDVRTDRRKKRGRR